MTPTISIVFQGVPLTFVPSYVFDAQCKLVRVENRDRVEFDTLPGPPGRGLLCRGFPPGSLTITP